MHGANAAATSSAAPATSSGTATPGDGDGCGESDPTWRPGGTGVGPGKRRLHIAEHVLRVGHFKDRPGQARPGPATLPIHLDPDEGQVPEKVDLDAAGASESIDVALADAGCYSEANLAVAEAEGARAPHRHGQRA